MYGQWPYYYARSVVNPYDPIYQRHTFIDHDPFRYRDDYFKYASFGNNSYEHDYRQYPEVDPSTFQHSAEAFRQLMQDAGQLFTALGTQPDLAREMMDAAQVDDKERVEELIHSTGVVGNVELQYTPESLTINMDSQAVGTECCQLTLVFRW